MSGADPLFPEIEPYRTGMLALDGLHSMYWEESGNRDGVPVVFLHGGPGAGCSAQHRRFFDPAWYRIVLYDQRGAGRSRPLAELRDNTTAHLVNDLDVLRRHLGIESWLVFGGSWGSTLALAYAQRFPERCLGLVLRGVFLCREAEIEWFMHGMRRFFPEHWRSFAGYLPEAERGSLLESYAARLNHPDPKVHMPAAQAWSAYEGSCSTLMPDEQPSINATNSRLALGLARIECHYFMHKGFMAEGALLEGTPRLEHMPGIIVQGRYDMVCPPESAYELHHAWRGSVLSIVPDAGHSAWEPGVRRALVGATESFRRSGWFT
ncbi:MAG TPA: prolyl aminopeptidase [Burkholderiales bacterium]|nr:prolyl aminopeptidase [Burkholderiales bacterium]